MKTKYVYFKENYYSTWCLKVVNHALRRDLHVNFVRCNTNKNADIIVEFCTNKKIVQLLGITFDGKSAASLSGRPKFIYFNRDRFINPPKHFPDKVMYRRYLVRHEFVHTLGVPHRETETGTCSLMTHQTILKSRCKPNDSLAPGDVEFIRSHQT